MLEQLLAGRHERIVAQVVHPSHVAGWLVSLLDKESPFAGGSDDSSLAVRPPHRPPPDRIRRSVEPHERRSQRGGDVHHARIDAYYESGCGDNRVRGGQRLARVADHRKAESCRQSLDARPVFRTTR
jgi:hypothetical protein